MKTLRPECIDSPPGSRSLPSDTALYLIRDSVARRRTLIYGRLHDGRGRHCALGCFWTDNPNLSLSADLVEEVAAINDSLPFSASRQERWKKVMGWLRWKMKVLTNKEAA